ncbi:MAG: small-conductance mechanosensitive channel [Saprospiraceae bacterium]|jgi:small-conductance mechanosensitive channel
MLVFIKMYSLLKSLVSVLLKVLVVIAAAGLIGVEVTAFAALLGGAALATGSVQQGVLGHFGAGVMVLIFKPYRVGDLPIIEIEKFHENNVLLAVRPYAAPEGYWVVYFNFYREIKKAFVKAGITVAYPTRRTKSIYVLISNVIWMNEAFVRGSFFIPFVL